MVLRSRSESFTESDTSYASSNNDSSEASSSENTESNNSTTTATENTMAKSNPSKATITRVTIPRRIVIKYSSNIETPKITPPLAIIGTQNSESSDPGQLESDYNNDSIAIDDDTDVTTDEQTKNDTTITDATELSDDNETESESETEDETEIDDDSGSSGSESEDESSTDANHENGYTNGVNSAKEYELDDFQLLKTIGELKLNFFFHEFHFLFYYFPSTLLRINIFSAKISS